MLKQQLGSNSNKDSQNYTEKKLVLNRFMSQMIISLNFEEITVLQSEIERNC